LTASPTTTALTELAAEGTNRWHLGVPWIVLVPSDGHDGSGVLQTTYRMDSSAPTPAAYHGPFAVTPLDHQVCFASSDRAGNPEVEKCLAVDIDSAAPVATIVNAAPSPSVSVVSSDDASGVPSGGTSSRSMWGR